jgi:hypothetical protein
MKGIQAKHWFYGGIIFMVTGCISCSNRSDLAKLAEDVADNCKGRLSHVSAHQDEDDIDVDAWCK